MTIEKIYNKKEISVRSFNVCRYNKLITVTDLIDYYNHNNSFENLKGCGPRCQMELSGVHENYRNIADVDFNYDQKEDPLERIIPELTRTQREVINDFIVINTENLSVRSRNAISHYLSHNLNIRNFTNRIFLAKKFKLLEIKNVGPALFSSLFRISKIEAIEGEVGE